MLRTIRDFLTTKRLFVGMVFLCTMMIAASFFTDSLVMPVRRFVSIFVVPVQKGMNNLGMVAVDTADRLDTVESLQNENEELKAKVESLTEESNRLKEDSYELSRLRTLYSLDEHYSSWPKTAARVIGSNSDNWYSTFTIDKGSNDGIEKDMNVIAGNGLVGIVTEVHKNYSLVKSIIDDNAYVSGMVLGSGSICTVEGDLKLMDEGMIHVSNFKADSNVLNGDKIVTSNISSKYLEGILIGYAKDVSVDGNQMTMSGYIVPVVDFEHLQEVLVITKKKSDATSDD